MEQPQSELYLLTNVELDPDYNYTLDFENATAQQSYFMSKVDSVFDINEGYSFIRENQTLKVYAKIEDHKGVNYLMFKNNQKWFYAFVERKEYVSESVTRLTFKIDVMQTFMFDYEMQESFIDREHQDRFSADGKPIYNLQEENLNIGTEYNQKSKQTFKQAKDTNYYLIIAKENIFPQIMNDSGNWLESSANFTGTQINGYKTGLFVYIGTKSDFTSYNCNAKVINAGNDGNNNYWWLDPSIDEVIKNPNVLCVKLIKYLPTKIRGFSVDNDGKQLHSTSWDRMAIVRSSPSGSTLKYYHTAFAIKSITLNEWETLRFTKDSPVAHSNINEAPKIEAETKLFTTPYNLFRLQYDNEFFELKRENFSSDDIVVNLYQSISVNGRKMLIPQNYNNAENDLFDGKPVVSSHDMNLRTDAWEQYVLNNKASINGGLAVSGAQTLSSVGLGLLTGGIGFAVAGAQALSFGGQIANEMLKRQDIKNQPNEVRVSADDTFLKLTIGEFYFNLINYEIKPQFKQAIFKYFTHYGYKCNDFKKPNLRSRYYFNYIKTIGANIKTNIDSEYKNELMRIFNQGVTIWHFRNANTFKGVNNYDYENAEMSLIGG